MWLVFVVGCGLCGLFMFICVTTVSLDFVFNFCLFIYLFVVRRRIMGWVLCYYFTYLDYKYITLC